MKIAKTKATLSLLQKKATPEAVNFFTREGRGVVCAPITYERARELNLEPMVDDNTSLDETPFTVSIDYLPEATTGVSAAERAATIKALTNASATAESFGRPGHIFPLRAVEGGVLRRAGHTEAVVDLCNLAGLYPAVRYAKYSMLMERWHAVSG